MKKTIIAFSLVVITMLVGCKTSNEAITQAGLAATTWEVSSIEGKDVVASEFSNGLPTAVFTTDNKVSGHGGCNSYGGSYTLDTEGNLTFSQFMSTKMFCEGNGENSYMKAIGKANKAKIENNNLVLYNGTNAVLVFVPKK